MRISRLHDAGPATGLLPWSLVLSAGGAASGAADAADSSTSRADTTQTLHLQNQSRQQHRCCRQPFVVIYVHVVLLLRLPGPTICCYLAHCCSTSSSSTETCRDKVCHGHCRELTSNQAKPFAGICWCEKIVAQVSTKQRCTSVYRPMELVLSPIEIALWPSRSLPLDSPLLSKQSGPNHPNFEKTNTTTH